MSHTPDHLLKPMQLTDIDPQLQHDIGKLPTIPLSSTWGRWLIRFLLPFAKRPKAHTGVQVEKHKTREGVQVWVYSPDTPKANRPALLWIHGGGLLIGSAIQDDDFYAETARSLDIVVVSTDYRLAPENPFPAAIDDCFGAWQWLQQSASQLQINPQQVAIGGQSAGGGLAANLAQRLYDQDGIQPVAQWLFCPMLDDRTAMQEALDPIAHLVWNNTQNRVGWRSYLGKAFGTPYVAPYAVAARRENLRGLPPTWIGTGDIELFYAENVDYAERLNSAGVPCTLDIVPNAPHGFEAICLDAPLTHAYLARSRAWLAEQFKSIY